MNATTQPSPTSKHLLVICSEAADQFRIRSSSCLVPPKIRSAAPLLSTALIINPSPLASYSPKKRSPPRPPSPLHLPPRPYLSRHPPPHFLTASFRCAIQHFNPALPRQTIALAMVLLTRSPAAQSIALPANAPRPYSQTTREESRLCTGVGQLAKRKISVCHSSYWLDSRLLLSVWLAGVSG